MMWKSVTQEPVLFLKPTSSYLENGGTIEVPHPLNSLDYEVELAVVIGKTAREVPENTAMNYVGGNFESFLIKTDGICAVFLLIKRKA